MFVELIFDELICDSLSFCLPVVQKPDYLNCPTVGKHSKSAPCSTIISDQERILEEKFIWVSLFIIYER